VTVVFTKRFTLFRLLGFEVKIDLTWLLLALLVTWTLARGVFPAYFPGLSAETYWWMGIGGTAGLLVSIVFHELCHSLVARRYGLPIKGITLFIFGGVAEMEDEPPSPKAEFLMAVAGPVASIVLALLLAGAYTTAKQMSLPAAVTGVLYYLAYLNFLLAVFNLIPAFPLDGGRMLRAALWGWKRDIRWATRISSAAGSGFGLALIILAVLAVLQGNFIVGMWWFLIGLFIRTAAGMSYQRLLMQQTLRGEHVRRFMNASPVTAPRSISLQQLVEDYIYKHQHKMFPVVDNTTLAGCITTRDVKAIPREQWARTTVADVYKPCSGDNTIAADADALEALSLMTRTGNSRLMVVERGKLVGIIALKDLLRFLSLKLELDEQRS
jgi:Zn-dependent protease/predicted transcriptional regulator